jgi:hypothetical protein
MAADGKIVRDPDNGVVVRKNPRASEHSEKKVAAAAGTADPRQVVRRAVAAGGGKEPEVETRADMPVSKTDKVPARVTLAPDAGPAEALHEAKHVLADQGRGPEPKEGKHSKEV